MTEQELIEKMARELYDFAGRYGAHRGKLWEDLSDFVKDEYRKEAQFLVDEFIKKAGYLSHEEVQSMLNTLAGGFDEVAKAKGYVKPPKTLAALMGIDENKDLFPYEFEG